MNLKLVKLFGALSILWYAHIGLAQAQDNAGEQLFQTYCAACHSIGEGRRIGPDLIDVHQIRSQAWLQQFITSAQAMVDAGDADAIALFEEYSPMIMPDSAISAEQVDQVIAYIASRSGSGTEVSATPAPVAVAATPAPASEEDIAMGASLFEGSTRFQNRGPACNACHGLNNDAVTAGASLAVDLTTAYSRISGAGLAAMMAQAPFPAMQVAYGDRPLTEGEIDSLVAFFAHADEASDSQQAADYGRRMLFSGVFGAVLLFVLMPVWWRNRRTGSVNQSIYDRQDRTGQ